MQRRVILIRNIQAEKFGGAETYQLSLGSLLAKNGYEPYILTTSGRLLKESKKAGINTIEGIISKRQNWSGVYNLLFPIFILREIRLFFWYKKIFKKYNPSVINVQSRDDWIAATCAAKKLKIRVLWTDHMDFRSWVLQNIDNPIKNFVGKMLLRIARKADKIIFISDYEYAYFRSLKSTRFLKNTCVIKNGSFDKKADFEDIKTDDKSFAYVGRVIDYKGIDELIRAFNELSKKHGDCTLRIYGDGPDIDKYRKAARNNKNIIFYGYTDEPLKAIKESRFFVLPSYREGLSLSLLDAAMMGRCIIATNVDGNPEIVKDYKTGLLVKPKNASSLKNALLYAYENKNEIDKIMIGARNYFENEFDFERIFNEKMKVLYE